MHQTEFADGCFYGIELTEGIGDCDGSIDDVQYFECKPNEGVFVKRKLLRRIKPKNKQKRKTKSHKDKKQKKRKKQHVKHTKSLSTLGGVDISSVYGDRPRAYSATKRKDDDYYRRMRESMKKAGPREIGRMKYKGIKTKKKKDPDPGLSRSQSYTAKSAKIHKLGPRGMCLVTTS